MPKRRKNRYNEHQFRDEYTRIRAPELSVFSGLDHLLALAIRTSEGGPVHYFRLIPSRSKDLERTEPPYLHTPPISMSCSPLPPPSAPLSPSRSCFFPDRVRCKLQYSRATRSDMKNIYRFLDRSNLLLPPSHVLLYPLLVAPVQFPISRRGKKREKFTIIIARIRS